MEVFEFTAGLWHSAIRADESASGQGCLWGCLLLLLSLLLVSLPALLHSCTNLLVECSHKVYLREKRKSWCYLQCGKRMKGGRHPNFENFILVILKKTQQTPPQNPKHLYTENSELQLLRSATFIAFLKAQPLVSALPRAPWPAAQSGCPLGYFLFAALSATASLCVLCLETHTKLL